MSLILCVNCLVADSIGGNALSLILGCVSGAADQSAETTETLRFLSTAGKLQGKPKPKTSRLDLLLRLIAGLQQTVARAGKSISPDLIDLMKQADVPQLFAPPASTAAKRRAGGDPPALSTPAKQRRVTPPRRKSSGTLRMLPISLLLQQYSKALNNFASVT